MGGGGKKNMGVEGDGGARGERADTGVGDRRPRYFLPPFPALRLGGVADQLERFNMAQSAPPRPLMISLGYTGPRGLLLDIPPRRASSLLFPSFSLGFFWCCFFCLGEGGGEVWEVG